MGRSDTGHSPVLDRENPYAGGFHNPPWTLLALTPFAIDEELGRGALFVVSLTVCASVAIQLKAKPLALALWLTCPPLLHTLLHGNLEWLVRLGCAATALGSVLRTHQTSGRQHGGSVVGRGSDTREGGWRASLPSCGR